MNQTSQPEPHALAKNPALALIFGLLLPGAGHFYIGQRVKAICFLAVIIPIFIAGLIITDGGILNADRHPYALIIQALNGIPAAIALPITRDTPEPPGSTTTDFGMLLTLCAGALNLLVIADALYKAAPIPAHTAETRK